MTCGFGLAMAICVPFGFLNLEENMWFQFMSFVCLGLFTTEFVGQFAIEGLEPSRTPAFAGPNVFEAFGVGMFTYAFIVTVPSWVNEKKPAVSVKKVMWTSALTCSLLQLAFGLLGAWAFDLVGPKATCTKSDCQNILLIFDHPDMPVITRYSSYLFMLTTLVPGIPVLAIVVRYNLQSSGLCSRIGATFWGVIAPWVIALFLYNTPYFVKVLPRPPASALRLHISHSHTPTLPPFLDAACSPSQTPHTRCTSRQS